MQVVKNVILLLAPLLFLSLKGHAQNLRKSDSSGQKKHFTLDFSDSEESLIDPDEEARKKGDSVISFYMKNQFDITIIPKHLNVPKLQNRSIFYDNLLESYKPVIDSILAALKSKTVDEIDTSFISLKWFNIIDNQIKILDKEIKNKNDFKLQIPIIRQIENLPPSSAKVLLQLKLSDVVLKNTTYNSNFVKSELQLAVDKKELLYKKDSTRLYELSMADFFIAEYAKKYFFTQTSIRFYYEALRYISDDMHIDTTLKNYREAQIYVRIGALFRELNLLESTLKSISYFNEAVQLFGKSNRRSEGHDVLKYFPAQFPWYVDSYSGVDSIDENTLMWHKRRMRDLGNLFATNMINVISGKLASLPSLDCFNFYTIGTIFKDEKLPIEALRFYQLCLLATFQLDDYKKTFFALNATADGYLGVGDFESALKYSNTALEMATAGHDHALYLSGLVKKATLYQKYNLVDSALYFLNLSQRNFEISNPSQRYIYQALSAKVFEEKAKIFKSYNNDSSFYYQKRLRDTLRSLYLSYNDLLKDEAYSENNWTKANAQKIIIIERAQKNAAVLADSLEKGISKLAWDSARIAKANAAKEKSQRLKIDSLYSQLQTKDQKLQTSYDGLGIAAILLLLSTVAIIMLAAKNNAKKKKLIQSKEGTINLKDRISHELQYMIGIIPELIKNHQINQARRSLSLAEIQKYSSEVKKFSQLLLNTEVGKINKLQEEILLGQTYLYYFKLSPSMDCYEINLINCITDEFILSDLPIPIFLITNFIMNSIRHATADRERKVVNIWIRHQLIPIGHELVVEDDGCGINYTKNIGGTSTGKGFKLVVKSVEDFNTENREYRIKLVKESIIDKSDFGGQGTKVTIEFINLR